VKRKALEDSTLSGFVRRELANAGGRMLTSSRVSTSFRTHFGGKGRGSMPRDVERTPFGQRGGDELVGDTDTQVAKRPAVAGDETFPQPAKAKALVAWVAVVVTLVVVMRASTAWPMSAVGAAHSLWHYCHAVAQSSPAAGLPSALVAGMTSVIIAACTAAMLLVFAV
jgi:hypothetical protein